MSHLLHKSSPQQDKKSMIPGVSHVTRGCPTSMLNPDSHPEISHYHYKCTIAKEYQLNKERILSKGKHQSLHIIVDSNPILQFLETKLTLT